MTGSSQGYDWVATEAARLQKQLLSWFAEHKRPLPWRSSPTPYGVWVSEVMSQQTRVEVVRDYYQRWMAELPNLAALAAAEEEDVLRLWQGLGYYSRARRLREGAKAVVERFDGELPSSAQELLTIPGIGPYSAGAISSIAFGRQAALVDGNVIRVLTRLFALEGNPAKAPLKKDIWTIAERLVPKKQPGDFNQALMELGAMVCTPRSPSCVACPVRKSCRAFKQGEPTRFPQLEKKAPPTPLTMALILIRHRGRFAVQKLSSDARWWAGLDAFPFLEIESEDQLEKKARKWVSRFAKLSGTPEQLPHVRHTVTRFKITLCPIVFDVSERKAAASQFRFISSRQLREATFPAPHKRVAEILLSP